MKRLFLLFFVGLLLLPPEASLGSEPGTPDSQILFRSRNRTLAELDREVTALYLSLHNAGRLTVQYYQIKPDDTIERILRGNQLFFGSKPPAELDSLVCELNPQLCERELRKPPMADQNTLTRHVSGFAALPGKWKLPTWGLMILPKIDFEVFNRWDLFQKPAGRPLQEIVEHETGGCPKFDAECRDEILAYNSKLGDELLSADFAGMIALPVKSVRAVVDTMAAAAMDSSADDLLLMRRDQKLRTLQPSGDGQSNEYKVREPANPPPTPTQSRELYRVLQPNIVGGASAKVQQIESSLFANDFKQHTMPIRELIGLPYQKIEEYPDYLHGAVPIAVLDRWVDGDHCALPKTRITVENIESPVFSSRRGQCATMVNGNAELNHGTHIVGIIAAQHPKDLPTGINPFASVRAKEIDFKALEQAVAFSDHVRELTKLIRENRIEVVNLSFGYFLKTGSIDELESMIRSMANHALFVAAAGNYGSDKSNICDLRPACFNFANLISVAALNRDKDRPDIMTAEGKKVSNYGTSIHVGAVGEQVFSTVANGHFGIMSGTSQAAPQVTAVASLLMARFKTKPVEAKNRIIACSDHVGAMQDKLFAGRVNAACTLDADTDRIEVLQGTLHRGSLRHTELVFHASGSSRKLVFDSSDIAALHYDSARKTYTAFYYANARRDTTVLRETGLRLVGPERVDFDVKGKIEPIGIQTSDIAKYVARTHGQ